MYSLLVCVALLMGADDAPSQVSQVEFSAEVMVEKWKYNFEEEKWEKKWIPAEVDSKGVHIKHGQNFAVRVESNHAYFSNVKVVLEEKDRGTWKLEPWQAGFLKKCAKGDPFVFKRSKGGTDLSVSFTSRQTKETRVIKLKLLEAR